MLILIFLGVATGGAVFYIAWRLSSNRPESVADPDARKSSSENEEPGAMKE